MSGRSRPDISLLGMTFRLGAGSPRYRDGVDMDAVDRVLAVVAVIPAGRAASYGQVGDVAGVGPRQVGAIMARYGSGVPWWRVTNHDGVLPPDLAARALALWRAEGTPLRVGGARVDVRLAACDSAELEQALAGLSE